MVDVSAKDATERMAVAEGRVIMRKETLDLVLAGNAMKGDVLGAARLAGIMAAKRTHGLIPLCHPLPITKVEIDINPEHSLPGFLVQATVKVTGQTGVEMEALTAVSIACLTIYDMVKAVERGMRIEGIRLLRKERRQVRRLPRRRTRPDGVDAGRRSAAARAGRRARRCRRRPCALDDALGRVLTRGRRGAAHAAAGGGLGHGRLCGARRRRGAGAGHAQADRRSRRRPSVRRRRSAPARPRASSPAA